MKKFQTKDSIRDAFLLRLNYSDSPPFCRITLKNIEEQEQFHFSNIDELSIFLTAWTSKTILDDQISSDLVDFE